MEYTPDKLKDLTSNHTIIGTEELKMVAVELLQGLITDLEGKLGLGE